MSLLGKLQSQNTQGVRKIEVVELTITGIIPLKEDKLPKDKEGKFIPKSQVITSEAGSLFVFDSSIINKPASLAFGAKASISLEEKSYTDKAGNPATTVNVIRVEFTSLDEVFRTSAKYGANVSLR